MRFVSRSISATGKSSATGATQRTVLALKPCARTTAEKRAAVIASTRGYRAEIRSPHLRHWPRRSSQESTGMLSYGRIGVSQPGRREAGVASDWPAGRRYATTLRNEPMIKPPAAATKPSMSEWSADRRAACALRRRELAPGVAHDGAVAGDLGDRAGLLVV